MPAADTAPRRPNMAHRHSSSSVNVARSPHAELSSSAQKHQRTARFVVGNNRLGARNPSYGKNINKLSKLTPARPADASPTSPTRPTHVKRNSSNVNLDTSDPSSAGTAAAPLRKNHSETSLKKNRSAGHLVKLARPSSSRNVSAKVATKNRHRRSRTSLGGIQAPEGPGNPTVRFDLGHEEEEDDADTHDSDGDDDGSWTYTDSRSPSTTRSSTRRNSLSSQAHADESRPKSATGAVDSDDKPASTSLHPGTGILSKSKSATTMTAATSPSTRPPAIMNRLLKRNLSFTAAPQVTSNPATPIMIDPHEPVSQSHNTLNDSSNPEVVSRFLTQSSSTSGPSHESNFLPRRTESSSGRPESEAPSASHSPDGDDDQSHQKPTHERDPPRRNKSLPSFSEDYVSRTQQRLNLERESAAAESTPVAPPRTLLHVSRLSSANIPFTAASSPGGGVAIHVRQLCDRSAVEYKRVRMYQNPLASAITRLRETGQLSRPATAPTTKPATKSGSGSGSGSGTRTPTAVSTDTAQLSQSWRSARSVKAAEPAGSAPKPAPRRPRVMFQGINASPDDEREDMRGRASLDGGADERRARSERDVLRELCGRLWARNDTGLAGGD